MAAERWLKTLGMVIQDNCVQGDNEKIDLAWLILHPQALRGYNTNWEQLAPLFVRRLIA